MARPPGRRTLRNSRYACSRSATCPNTSLHQTRSKLSPGKASASAAPLSNLTLPASSGHPTTSRQSGRPPPAERSLAARLARWNMGSGLARLPRCALEPAPVGHAPRLVAGRHVAAALPQPDGPVDELPDDVGVAGVAVGLGDHVYDDPVQRHLAPVLGPPRHL